MCGIYGIWANAPEAISQEFLAEAGTALQHRGPDHQGQWFDPAINLGLGHRRLAILDLSPQGLQPMQSANGRYVLTFNGEIYNFADLKADLISLGHTFRGASDTEVMLAAFSEWGVEAALQKLVGMFAFALWDRAERVLTLGRDRLGEKPIYYGWLGQTFIFGSELKALQAHPHWESQIDRQALALFLRHSYIPAPYSIYQGIYKLPPGTVLQMQSAAPSPRPMPQPYWSMADAVTWGQKHPFAGNAQAAVEQLDSLLCTTVRQQMVADVPLGAFLSGGVDSSTVTALMQAQSSQPIKTFTIGFHEADYNEAERAKAVAQHLGTQHTELYVTAAETRQIIPELPVLYDEPFADPSQIPTYLIAQLARQQVTVSLSGDGGDEIFGGYNRYLWASRIWQQVGWLPPSIRTAIAAQISQFPPHTWNQIWKTLSPMLPGVLNQRLPGEKLHKLARVLASQTPQSMYMGLVSQWQFPIELVKGVTQEPPTTLNDPSQWPNQGDFAAWMMSLDAMSYLPGDILTKVDRAAMGVSLETRIPFLDHRIVEFANSLPIDFKIHSGQGKWLLRQVLYRYVPADLIERPKMGFSVPIGNWLRAPLREWAEDLLHAERLQRQGFLEPDLIRSTWQQHLSGKENHQYPLWNVMMFQAWLEKNGVS
ncbi:MAG: asparagine synthase (glutamine-hydrolyzing) [Cyanobacteria bacterium P01_A01_bin.37]